MSNKTRTLTTSQPGEEDGPGVLPYHGARGRTSVLKSKEAMLGSKMRGVVLKMITFRSVNLVVRRRILGIVKRDWDRDLSMHI